MGDHRKTLSRLATLTTLSRSAGEGYGAFNSKLLSRTAGEGGPSPKGSVGEGAPAPRGNNNPRALKGVPDGFQIRVGASLVDPTGASRTRSITRRAS